MTPPSAQTEINTDVAYYILPHGMDRAYGEKDGIIYVATQVRLEDIRSSTLTEVEGIVNQEKNNYPMHDVPPNGRYHFNDCRGCFAEEILDAVLTRIKQMKENL